MLDRLAFIDTTFGLVVGGFFFGHEWWKGCEDIASQGFSLNDMGCFVILLLIIILGWKGR